MTFRMLEPHEVEGYTSRFQIGDRVRVHMPPYDPWEGAISRRKWFTGAKPGDEPTYEVTDANGNPRGYSGHWITKI